MLHRAISIAGCGREREIHQQACVAIWIGNLKRAGACVRLIMPKSFSYSLLKVRTKLTYLQKNSRTINDGGLVALCQEVGFRV